MKLLMLYGNAGVNKRMYLTNELTKEEYDFLKQKIEKIFESQIDVEELKTIHINEEKQL